MLDREKAIVLNIIFEDAAYQELDIIIEHQGYKAINFIGFTGRCKINDEVLLNTTGMRLNL